MGEINISDIENDISAILRQENAILIDFSLKNLGANPIIQVFADNERGINAGELAEISRKISKMLDEIELFPKNYRLDVSSPGIDRPLRFLWQYKRNIDRYLEVIYEDNNDKIVTSGMLKSVTEQSIILQSNKQELEIKFPQIIKAVVQIRFK